MPHSFFYMPIAYGVQKHSPYLAIIDHQLKRMVEKGIYNAISRRWNIDHPDCKPRSGRALGFNNMAMAFAIYVLGLIGSVVILFFEAIFTCHKIVGAKHKHSYGNHNENKAIEEIDQDMNYAITFEKDM